MTSGVDGYGRRPTSIVTAVMLMVPVGLTWLAAAVGCVVVMINYDGTGTGGGLVLFLFGLFALLCLLQVAMTVAGSRWAWRGQRRGVRLQIPANFTLGLFALSLIGIIAQGKLAFEPTMLLPIVVGILAGVALWQLKKSTSLAWLTR